MTPSRRKSVGPLLEVPDFDGLATHFFLPRPDAHMREITRLKGLLRRTWEKGVVAGGVQLHGPKIAVALRQLADGMDPPEPEPREEC